MSRRKVHRLWYNSRNEPRTICGTGRGLNGYRAAHLDISDDWDRVTCAACLKQHSAPKKADSQQERLQLV